jgi:hypothetical protein
MIYINLPGQAILIIGVRGFIAGAAVIKRACCREVN